MMKVAPSSTNNATKQAIEYLECLLLVISSESINLTESKAKAFHTAHAFADITLITTSERDKWLMMLNKY
jgi:hypothetical protein